MKFLGLLKEVKNEVLNSDYKTSDVEESVFKFTDFLFGGLFINAELRSEAPAGCNNMLITC